MFVLQPVEPAHPLLGIAEDVDLGFVQSSIKHENRTIHLGDSFKCLSHRLKMGLVEVDRLARCLSRFHLHYHVYFADLL